VLCLSHDSRCSLPGTFSERHLQSEKTTTRTLRTSAPCRNDRPGCLATTVRRTRFAEYNVDLHQVRQELLHTKKVKQNKKQISATEKETFKRKPEKETLQSTNFGDSQFPSSFLETLSSELFPSYRARPRSAFLFGFIQITTPPYAFHGSSLTRSPLTSAHSGHSPFFRRNTGRLTGPGVPPSSP